MTQDDDELPEYVLSPRSDVSRVRAIQDEGELQEYISRENDGCCMRAIQCEGQLQEYVLKQTIAPHECAIQSEGLHPEYMLQRGDVWPDCLSPPPRRAMRRSLKGCLKA